MELLVSTDWLANELGANDLRVVDATNLAHDSARDAHAEHEAGHIPGAIFLDLANLKDEASALPNMLPPAEKFASRMQSLGLGDGSRIVLYDNSPYHSAARAWYMFRMFGVNQVAILDGGLPKWTAEGRSLEVGKTKLRHRHFTVWRDPAAVRDIDQMMANVVSGAEEVVDARPEASFTGEQGGHGGLAAGHIPGAKNLPYDRLFNADGTFRSKGEIRAAFDGAGIDPSKPLVTHCGQGGIAAVLLFGAALLGRDDIALYDGSWSEWGARADTEKELGAAPTAATAA